MTKKIWLIVGLFWALGMMMFISLLYPILVGKEINAKHILIDLAIYLFTGFVIGFVIYRFAVKTKIKR